MRLQSMPKQAGLNTPTQEEIVTATNATLELAVQWNTWQAWIAGTCRLVKAWSALVTVRVLEDRLQLKEITALCMSTHMHLFCLPRK
jgi:hypothetical protein